MIMNIISGFLSMHLQSFSNHALAFVFPAYLCFSALSYIWRSIFSENVAGKVVVVAGASSGIGEHIAYEYGRRGAYLVIGARRKNTLNQVAEQVNWLGSPCAVPVQTDVSNVEDCKQLIEEAINQFGRLDHLVLSAGVTPVSMFEELNDVSNFAPAMDVNFWGLAYLTYFAAPHLRETRGKIIVIASAASWLNEPRLSFYAASKAAVVSFFETLRVEFGSNIGITIVTPGLIESEMTKGKFLNKDGKMVVDQQLRDVVMTAVPIERAERMAKTTVDSACRGDKYMTVPSWFKMTFFVKMFLREPTDWIQRWLFVTEQGASPAESISKKIIDFPVIKDIFWPDSVRSPKIKSK